MLGSGAGAGRTSASVAHPTPMRPWSAAPVAKAMSGSISSGAARRSTAARIVTFSDRFVVDATTREAVASSTNSTQPSVAATEASCAARPFRATLAR